MTTLSKIGASCLFLHNTIQHAVPNIKQTLMQKWHFRSNNDRYFSEILKDPPLVSYKRGRSLKDLLVLSETQRSVGIKRRGQELCRPATPIIINTLAFRIYLNASFLEKHFCPRKYRIPFTFFFICTLIICAWGAISILCNKL